MQLEIELQTGTLRVLSTQPETLLELAGFGSRMNLKRGFVFVSKVLGKHYPTRPAALLAIYQQLAAQIKPALLPGPTWVIGFAETATGLGHGVYAQLAITDGFYSHTTRYAFSRPVWLSFQEEHSHATAHDLYALTAQLQALQPHLVNVVLVDDEFSTGQTIYNLLRPLKALLPGVKRWIAASILSWVPAPDPELHWVSLHHGRFVFTPKPQALPTVMPSATGAKPLLDAIIPHNFARYGRSQLRLQIPPLAVTAGQKILCLGTSEFHYPAYQLAAWLQTQGVDSFVQATTRSPLNVDGIIEHKLTFGDNYGENINHYLYNLRADYDQILVCYETQALPTTHDLLTQLAAYSPQVIPLFLQPETD